MKKIITKKVNRSLGGTLVLMLFLTLMGMFMALPMIYAVGAAFKPLEEIFLFPPRLFPQNPTFLNFKMMGETLSNLTVPFERYLFNSIFISIVSTVVYLFIAILAAYPLAKHDFPGKAWINEVITVALMFTASVTGLVQYLIISLLGMIDSYAAVILPTFANTMGVFLCKQYMTGIPTSMLEAGKVDGANELTIFIKLVIPNIKPVIFTMLIFQFQGVWNSTPGNVIYSEELKTLPQAMNQIATAGISRAGVGSAAALLLMIPPIAVFLISQSNVMETMAHSGIKE